MKRAVISVILLGACAAGCQLHRPADLGGETLPAAPTPALPYQITGMKIRVIPPITFLHTTVRTSFNDIAGPLSKQVPAVQSFAAGGRAAAGGPLLLIYHDPSENPAKPFDLDIGLPLNDPALASGPFQLRALPAFRCATVIFRGPMKFLPNAYDKLIPDMIAAGCVPSGETRESYLVWKGAESAGNVVQIEVGIR